ncbi:DUF1648 domain-containing protein [Pseudogracilibacillus sp. SO30301A]|uniref:DUF1648 domain-containing protein n=1 Tax=Pseudogracilibacillus sp. SO30301A TaxID=3098291 RepID=UPI00300E521F
MNSQIIFLNTLFILICFIFSLTPYLTRKTENFGVSIPESLYERNDFKGMRKKYASSLLIIGIFLGGGLFVLASILNENTMIIMYTIIIFVYILLGFLIYLLFYKQMKKIKNAENWQEKRKQSVIVDMKFRQEKITYSQWWFLISAMIIIATLVITFLYYDRIPAQIPMHTGFSGNVSYEEKSIVNLLLLPGTQVLSLIMFIFINFIIKNAKQQVSVENPETSKLQNLIFRRRWSAFLIWTAALTQSLLLFSQLTLIFPSLSTYENLVIYVFTSIIIVGTLILAFTTGQGGSRVKLEKQSDTEVIDRDDDRYWKLGQFYVNRNDPAIFIEKRFGIGWTNNWAHPLSWGLVLVLIIIIMIPIILF